MSVLYVTSFNKTLYQNSGRKMLDSFYNTKCEGDMLVTYDGSFQKDYGRYPALDRYCLDKDPWLAAWTANFKEYLPEKYGGVKHPNYEYGLEKYPPGRERDGIIEFRQGAGRWAKKTTAMKVAFDKFKHDYIVYLDCDIVIRRKITMDFIYQNSKDFDVVYHMGNFRIQQGMGIESGVIIFNVKRGREFLNSFFDLYTSGKFLNYKRSDDGYLLWENVKLLPHLSYRDLVPDHQVKHGGHVVREGIFKDYLEHYKGSHKKNRII